MPRAPTSSSCSPTTARRRARRSSSATAMAWIELVERSVERRRRSRTSRRATRTTPRSATRSTRPPAPTPRTRSPQTSSAIATWSCSAPGTWALIYLMEENRRLTLEEIEERHPRLIPALRDHPHVGFLLVRSAEHGPRRARSTAARTTWPTVASRAKTRSPRSRQTPPRICGAPTALPTSPTSWSTASTTPSSSRAARSRS